MGDLTLVKPPKTDISIQDKDNPRSIINLVPDSVRSHMERIPPSLLEMNEDQLEELLPKKKWTVVDQRLRTAFWIEYNRAQDAGQNLNMSLVYSGICARGYFYNYVLENKARLAHLLLPPADYKVSMEEALTFGVNRLREILELPLYDDRGKADAKVADVILKTVQMLDQRVKGAVIQKIQQQNLNMNMDSSKLKGAAPESMDEIDRKLAELQAKIGSKHSQAQSIAVDAEVIEDEEK